MIHLSVENERTQLLGLDPFLRYVLDLELRYPTPQAETAEKMGLTLAQLPWADGEAGGWDGWVKLFHTPKTQPAWFPTGLLPHVLAHCAKYRYQVQVQDLREVPEGDIPEPREIPLRDYQAEAVQKALEVGRGILDMPPRCHALGEYVRSSSGELALVDTIQVGDRLLGPDGTARVVLEVHRGVDELYRVTPRWGGYPFIVNQHHELYLKKHARLWKRFEWQDKVVSIRDFLRWARNSTRVSYLRRSGVVEFPDGNCDPLPVDPYVLGVLLGDGCFAGTPTVTTNQPILQEALLREAHRLGLDHSRVVTPKGKSSVVYFSQGLKHPKGRPNALMALLREWGLAGCGAGEKFVPDLYLYRDSGDRLELLAGLLDTDGYLAGGGCYYEYSTKSPALRDAVEFLGMSLGLGITWRSKWVNGVEYFRVRVLGAISRIPVRLPHRQTDHVPKWRDPLNTRFEIEHVGRGEFVGFTVSGDNLYLGRDFTIFKNSGKTRTMTEIVRRLARPALWVAPTDRIVRQTVATLEGLVGRNYAFHLIGAKNAMAAGLARVVVCTAATAAGLPDEFFPTRQVLVVDEWHHAAAPTYKRLFQRCPHVYFRFGMTGTHFRSGADALAMHALISRVIHRVSSEDLVALGHLVPSKAVFIPVGGPMLRGVPSDFQTGHGRYGIHEHPLRQQMVAHAALMLVQAGRRPLVLVGTKRQGRMLKDILKALLSSAPKGAEFDVAEFVSTDMPRHRQSRALASFDDGAEIKVLIGTTILGEGVDLPTTDALVLARGEQAEVSLVQALYRSATAVPGKRDALVVDFADRHHRKLLEHSKARLAVYWSEPTFEVDVLDHARDFPGWLDRVAGNEGSGVNVSADRCQA